MHEADRIASLERRLERERARRRAAEAIAEETTRRLYASNEASTELAAQMDEVNAELRAVLATVSHDLIGPLTTNYGIMELWRVQGYFAETPHAELLDRLIERNSYMRDLLRDVLAVARLGQVEEERVAVELGELLDEVTAEVSREHPQLRVEAGELPTVEADRTHLRQLFTNLLRNACLHGGRPDPTVRVASTRGVDGTATLTFVDDGRGIPPEDREGLFELFRRGSETEGHGSGVGLAICRKVVARLDGTIEITDPEPDGPSGAWFRITLPSARIVA
ncbi:MAG: sensor histidine kinase [Actinomycetes bacterium]